MQRLKEAIPGTISDFLVRVDIMQLANGCKVVNEFESFEAMFCGEGKDATDTFLYDYWRKQISEHALHILDK